MSEAKKNLVLIGMPGVGKSTLGVLLAKATSLDFLDTDVVIQRREGLGLQEILERDGPAAFRNLEERHVLAIDASDTVVATGGSVVYSVPAMCHLSRSGVVIYLSLPFETLVNRLTNLGSRGVVRDPGQTMRDLYAERAPLYARWAEITIACEGKSHELLVEEILRAVQRSREPVAGA